MREQSSTFVSRGGELVLPSPLALYGAQLRCFWICADHAKLTALCERDFNHPSNAEVRVAPISSQVALCLARIEHASSLDHPSFGDCLEHDFAVWIPVRVRTRREDFIAWYLPYVFVDHPFAMATGRELYGFPKTIGHIAYPKSAQEAGDYTLDTWQILTHKSRLSLSRLLTMSPREELSAVQGVASFLGGAASLFGQADLRAQGENMLLQMRSLLGRREVPLIFLRQLRRVDEPARAALQEIIVAPCHLKELRSVRPIARRYQVRIDHSASHPIREELGLQERSETTAAFQAEFDFEVGHGRVLWSATTSAPPTKKRRRKIAVLGGGIGALSAVYAMTCDPARREELDITVYQMGWRLGGKGASSRNLRENGRIEEHGLHLWFGFYDRAFRMIREVYQEQKISPERPLATFEDAFFPQDRFGFQEEINGEKRMWILDFPRNHRTPGDEARPMSPREFINELLYWIKSAIDLALLPGERGWRAAAKQSLFAILATIVLSLERGAYLSSSPAVKEARALLRRLLRAAHGDSDDRRRLLLVLDLAMTCLSGFLEDDLLSRGFSAIDDEDLRAWLARHGASQEVLESAPIRVMYDMLFAYRDGDRSRPDIAAGATLTAIGRMLFAYSGAFSWKMNGGMGEVVFSPLYRVLKSRGVKFRFFHKAERLGLSPSSDEIESIAMIQQATLHREYDPLIEIDQIDCWPSEPRWEQLQEREALRGQSLESGDGIGRRLTLQRGRDFDAVILGIPVGALRPICHELSERYAPWRQMLSQMTTTATGACQLWLNQPVGALGWCASSPERGPVIGAIGGLFDTWADMTHTAARESWPERPQHVAYFCAPISEPPAQERDAATRRLYAQTRGFLSSEVKALWPSLYQGGAELWSALCDPSSGQGEERLAAQYIRANVEPSERYVQSHAGSMRSRLKPSGSGVENLFLAGDWTDNGFNMGCIEGAVRSGEQCAQGLLQYIDTHTPPHQIDIHWVTPRRARSHYLRRSDTHSAAPGRTKVVR